MGFGQAGLDQRCLDGRQSGLTRGSRRRRSTFGLDVASSPRTEPAFPPCPKPVACPDEAQRNPGQVSLLAARSMRGSWHEPVHGSLRQACPEQSRRAQDRLWLTTNGFWGLTTNGACFSALPQASRHPRSGSVHRLIRRGCRAGCRCLAIGDELANLLVENR